jgi:hypothetical protein
VAVPADIGEEERNQEMMKQWYQAEIRWAVMEQGQGLREWKDSVYFFMSESPDAAFQYALEIGYRECEVHEEDGTLVETRLAQVVSLACLGTNPTELGVRLGSTRTTDSLAFEHVFDPEGVAPMDVL